MPAVSATKQAILAAALELGALHGISGTTMDEVAELAGVAKGSVYYNFASKDALFEQLLTGGLSRLSSTLRSSRLEPESANALPTLVTNMLVLIEANRSLAKLMAAELFRTDRPWQEPMTVMRRDALEEIVQSISPLLPAQTPESTLLVIAGSIFGGILVGGLEWLLFHPETPVHDVAEAILFTFSGKLTGVSTGSTTGRQAHPPADKIR